MTIYHVDAFTKETFKGNSAGVCVLGETDIPDALKMKLAGELRHSETAFVLFTDERISLRWFTPKKEVDLCGHATLASAQVLWETGLVPSGKRINFSTRSGELGALKIEDKIELDFPQLFVDDCAQNPIVNEAFGIAPVYTGKNDRRYLLEIEDPGVLRSLQADFELLKRADLGGFMVTCPSDRPEYDFLSRFFAPGVGIPEDPVTGSAHCYLAPYWANKLGKNRLVGFQASERTGIVECELTPDGRVKLRGNAVILFHADFSLPGLD